MGEALKIQCQIDHALALSGDSSVCKGEIMVGSASDLFQLGRGTGCDDIPLQVSPGPLSAHVGLLRFEGFSIGYSLANRNLVFEQKDFGPTICLHTDHNSFDIDVLDGPTLQVRPAGCPSVCLIFHGDVSLKDEICDGSSLQPPSIDELWASVRRIFSRDQFVSAGYEPQGRSGVDVPSSDVMSILAAFRQTLQISHRRGQSNGPESMIEILKIAKKYECNRVDFIANKLQMTTRNLNYKSQRSVGVSPKRLIKSAALRDAMISIASSSKSGKPIGDIAYEIGYESFSRFSADYRILFGERPSATYQRYAGIW